MTSPQRPLTAAEHAAQSRRAQGLPPKVQDPLVARQLATLFRTADTGTGDSEAVAS